MQINVSPKGSKKLKEFNKREWPVADNEHYGQVLDWKEEHFVLEAVEQKAIVGTLGFKIEVGVAYIGTLVVAHEKRGKGIGKSLLKKAEAIAKEKNVHKIYLVTGKGWDAEKFYTALGYSVTGELPNHYFHKDFIELTKFL